MSLMNNMTEKELFAKYPEIVSIQDVMKMLNMGRCRVYRTLKSGQIKTVKVGNKYIIPKASVIAFIKKIYEE